MTRYLQLSLVLWPGKKHSYYNLCWVMSSRGKVIGPPNSHYECKKLWMGRDERVVTAWIGCKGDVGKILS